MREYDKIDTIYKRDTTGTKKLIEGAYRSETVEYLKDLDWVWTEKVDGTNIRVHWDGHKVEFGGRTDRAQIPAPLLNRLVEIFSGEANAQLFEQMFGEKEVIIFGEGYGAKIQNGGDYTDGCKCDFIVFDVLVNEYFLPEWSVLSIADAFGVKTVPIVGVGPLDEAVGYVKAHHKSLIGNRSHDMEGLVCRPNIGLRDRAGNRVIVKIKWEDFKHLQESL